VLFINLGALSNSLAQLPCMRVHPKLSGGEIVDTASVLERDIDCDRDGKPDFRLILPAKPGEAPTLANAAPHVTGVEYWARTQEGWIVRVGIHNGAG
jgi:hypothetical protein